MSSTLKKAFTLIELLVVIAIIGILSGLIIVGLGGMTKQATVAKAQVFNNSLRNSLLTDVAADIPLDVSYNDVWNNNTGTALGAPTAQAAANCVQNTCYSFDGTDDAATLPDITNYALTTQMTAMVWVKGSAQTGKVPFAHWDATGTSTLRGEWEIVTGAGGALRVVVSNDGTATTLAKDYITSAATPFDGNWHLVGFTFAPGTTTGTLTVYVDGVSAAVTQTVNGNVPTIYGSTAVLSLGCSVTGAACTAGTFFAGLIDSARFYDMTIPTSQIKELYFAGLNNLFAKGQITSEEYAQRVSTYGINN